VKGALVLLAGLGLLALIHRDVQAIAEKLVRQSHLDPASHYPRIFLDAASKVTDARLWLFAGAAGLYSLVRGVEAYGLWYERRWAEWFALVSGGLYIPIEIYELIVHTSWAKAAVLLTNVAVVAYMTYALIHSADQDRELVGTYPPHPLPAPTPHDQPGERASKGPFSRRSSSS
jgi:uncharacterized membrane protein (DUF2068 family)